MRPSQSSVLPKTPPQSPQPDLRPPPVVERIAAWSIRHRKTAVLGWLLLVAAIFLIGQHIGTSNVNSYDPGQSGQAERTLNRLNVKGAPPAESVLIQARNPAARFATDPAMRRAVAEVIAALHGLPRSSASDITSPLGPGGRSLISPDGRSALVTFNVIGNNATQAVRSRDQGCRLGPGD